MFDRLRTYQKQALNSVLTELRDKRSTLVVLPTGCHRAGQGILMFDGTIKAVEDIKVGDEVMGPDATVRTVIQLVRGRGPMVRIVPEAAAWKPFVVNLDHILTLAVRRSLAFEEVDYVDISVRQFLSWPEPRQQEYMLAKTDPAKGGYKFYSEWAPFDCQPLDAERYYGFTLTGDGRFLLADGTVTHNCGKTILFAALSQLAAKRGRVLVLAHREELIDQAKDKIERFAGLRVGVEMGDRTLIHQADNLPQVVAASIQTLSRPGRRKHFKPDTFCFVVVDEAHHAPADTYRGVLAYFSQAKVLGVTATPDRLDGAAMREVFESAAYVYEIRDAIEDGYLVPIRQRTVQIEGLDLSRIKTRGGDFAENELEAVLMDEGVLHEMAVPTMELAGDRPTMVFTASRAHAHAVAGVINRYRSSAAQAADGETPKEVRRGIIRDFENGKFQFLINCALWTEGFDQPRVACVSMARPTQSRAIYAQAIGRGTRTLTGLIDGIEDGTERRRLIAQSGKPDLLVLDMVGQAGRHTLINTTDILDGNRDADVRKLAMRILAADKDMPVLEALDAAADRLAEEKRARLMVGARYKVTDVDPFAMLGASSRAGRWGGSAPSDRQIETLKEAGIDAVKMGIDKGQAVQLISKLIERRERGLCTFKMAKKLAKYGLNPDVSFETARRALDAIADAGWKHAPADLFHDPELRPRAAGGRA